MHLVPVGTRVRRRFLRELCRYNIACWLSFREIDTATGGRHGIIAATSNLLAGGSPRKPIAAALRAGAPQIALLLGARGKTIFETKGGKEKEFEQKTLRRPSKAESKVDKLSA